MKFVGICGSQRVGSFNRMALDLIGDSLNPDDSFEVIDWRNIPAFCSESLGEKTPSEVSHLASILKAADAIIIASPEYNYSVPGMLKNLIDWLSKVDGKPLSEKPIALFSVTTGQLGGARMQYDLRKILLCLNANVLTKPEVFISRAKEKFNAEGDCVDAETQKNVAAQLEALRKLVKNS